MCFGSIGEMGVDGVGMRAVAKSASNPFTLRFPIIVGREQGFVVATAVVNAKNLDGLFGDCERDGYTTPKADNAEPRSEIIPGHSYQREVHQTAAVIDDCGNEPLRPVSEAGCGGDPGSPARSER